MDGVTISGRRIYLGQYDVTLTTPRWSSTAYRAYRDNVFPLYNKKHCRWRAKYRFRISRHNHLFFFLFFFFYKSSTTPGLRILVYHLFQAGEHTNIHRNPRNPIPQERLITKNKTMQQYHISQSGCHPQLQEQEMMDNFRMILHP